MYVISSIYIYTTYTLRRRRRNHEALWFRARAYFRVRVGASPLDMFIFDMYMYTPNHAFT